MHGLGEGFQSSEPTLVFRSGEGFQSSEPTLVFRSGEGFQSSEPTPVHGLGEGFQSSEPTPVHGLGEGFQGSEPTLVFRSGEGRRSSGELPPDTFVRRRRAGDAEGARGASPDTFVRRRRAGDAEGARGASPDKIGEAPAEPSYVDIKVRIHDETTGAIAEYTTNELDQKILNTLWDLWKTSDENGFLGAEKIIEALDKNVHVVGLGDPSNALLSFAEVPGASFWSSIIQAAPIDFVDKPLGSIERWVEIAGMIVGVMSGHMPMAYACFKALIHSEVHRMSATAIEHLIAGDHSANPHGDESPPNEVQEAHDVDLVTHPFTENTGIAKAARAERERADRERTARAEQDTARAKRERAERERADRERTARAEQERATAARAEREAVAKAGQEAVAKALRDGRSTAANAEVTKKYPFGGRSWEVREGREASSSTSLSPSNAPSGGHAAQNPRRSILGPRTGDHKLFDFKRLRIYYDSAYPATPINGAAQLVTLTRLIIIRESGQALSSLPDLAETIGGANTNAAGGTNEYVFIISNKRCQLWNATNERGFAWDPPSSAALQDNLGSTLLGRSPDLTGGGLVVRDIPAGSVDQHLDSAMGCIEVIGIIDASLPNLDDSGGRRGWLLIVLCRFSAVVSGSPVSGGWRCCPMCSGRHRLRLRRGGLLSGVAGTVRTGQVGAGRAHRRCQQARNASFQGQVRLIFSTRARAWRTSRAGRLRSR